MKAQLEKITSPLQSSFKAFLYRNKEFDAPWHFHPEFELTYIANSSGIRYVGDSVMEFEKGDLVLLGANLPHCWKNTKSDSEKAQSIVIQWKEDILGDGWLHKYEFIPIRKLLGLASRGLKFDIDIAEKVVPIMNQIINRPPFEKILLLLQALNILADAPTYRFLSSDNFTAKLNYKTNERINHIYNFVSDNHQRQIALAEVADLVGMGEETFCRFFKKTFNKPFFTFLNEYKIKLACKLLIESDLQVTEIAYRCGYESLPFFYRQFQKFMKCSPLVYRQKYERALG